MSILGRIGRFDFDLFDMKRFLRRGGPIMGLALVVVVIVTVRLLAFGANPDDVIGAKVERRTFVASVVEKGTLRAYRTETYSAPRLRMGGGQQILAMAPEGDLVRPGDMLVQFDDAALKERIRQQENEVERLEAERRRNVAQQESQMASLQAGLELAQHSYQQAVLNQAKLEFAAEVEKKREEINLQKSELSLQKAEESIESQKRQNATSLQRQSFRLTRARGELAELRDELSQSTLYANQPGLVSYEMTWGSNGRTKLKVGDAPFPGQSIISLPDLSSMVIEIQVSELDIRKVATGQNAVVRVDAYPDTLYTARVTDVSPLARRVGTSQLKVFDCTISIDGTDLSLRPGMSTQVMVISDYAEGAITIPVDAVFRKEGRTIVYTLDGGIEEVEVELGPGNGNYVIVTAGLEEGQTVALRDPYVPLRKIQSAGADALRQQRQGTGGGTSSNPGMQVFRMERMMSGGGSGGGGDRGRGRN